MVDDAGRHRRMEGWATRLDSREEGCGLVWWAWDEWVNAQAGGRVTGWVMTNGGEEVMVGRRKGLGVLGGTQTGGRVT